MTDTLEPGRSCPLSYRYPARVFDRAPEIETETLYLIGGLYGNREALAAILTMAEHEPGPVTLVFNGDFHWFDIASEDFAAIDDEVARHVAIRGNVETEIAADDEGAGCGCAYPDAVDDAVVERSNIIAAMLRETARGLPGRRAALGALPMHRVARVGDARVAIVHGDAESLAGWGFAHDALDDPERRPWLARVFAEAGVDVFGCSHTCLPALRAIATADDRRGAVINNGAAGMPNLAQGRYGIISRIGTRAADGALYGMQAAGAHIQALPVRYDETAWLRRFEASWPPGSPAHASYHARIAGGCDHPLALARAPREAAAGSASRTGCALSPESL